MLCSHRIDAVGSIGLASYWLHQFCHSHEYETDKRKRLGEENAKPKRIRHKPISREIQGEFALLYH